MIVNTNKTIGNTKWCSAGEEIHRVFLVFASQGLDQSRFGIKLWRLAFYLGKTGFSAHQTCNSVNIC